jgi:hypothetical protein
MVADSFVFHLKDTEPEIIGPMTEDEAVELMVELQAEGEKAYCIAVEWNDEGEVELVLVSDEEDEDAG